MYLMRRRSWRLIVLFSILLIGVVGYFFWGKIGKVLGWRTYRDARNGYEIRVPSGWLGEATEGAAEVFWSPDRKAYVAVQFITDPRLLEEGGEEKIIGEIRESFKKDPNYELFSFRSRFEEELPEPATVSGYMARGKLNFQKERYVFQEYAVQIGNEEILVVIRGAMQEEGGEKYENTVEEIMGSFDPVAGRRETIALVKKQKEVIEFERQLAKVGKKASYGTEDDGDSWLIRVYEIVEQDGDGHTATFNWYRVSKETKKITKEFETNK